MLCVAVSALLLLPGTTAGANTAVATASASASASATATVAAAGAKHTTLSDERVVFQTNWGDIEFAFLPHVSPVLCRRQ
jgi:hypothetical protein